MPSNRRRRRAVVVRQVRVIEQWSSRRHTRQRTHRPTSPTNKRLTSMQTKMAPEPLMMLVLGGFILQSTKIVRDDWRRVSCHLPVEWAVIRVCWEMQAGVAGMHGGVDSRLSLF